METRGDLQDRSLEDTLPQYEAIAHAVLERVRKGGSLEPLGVELLNLYFVAAKPTPEVGKALEAQYRETLLRQADQAIYRGARRRSRRSARSKRTSSTPPSASSSSGSSSSSCRAGTPNRKRTIAARLQKEAEYRAKAVELQLAAYQGQDPRIVLAVGLRELGANADKIGNLTITSEILAALLGAQPPRTE